MIRHSNYYFRYKLLQADSVATAWCAIYETHLLEVPHYPRKPQGSHANDLDETLTRMVCHFSYEDPPPKR